MRFDAEHVRRLKRLWQQLRREGGGGHLSPVEDPMDQLMEGVFANYAAESRAHSAVQRLRTAVVDLNELRITPVAEIVEIIGPEYPMCRAAADELCRTLLSLFNRTHKMDLMFLKKQSKKGAETFLNRLDGIGAYAKATILLRCFKAHVIPVDVHMLAVLRKKCCVPAAAPVEEVQKFLANHIRESEAANFYMMLKRHAAAHAPRKGVEYHPVVSTPPPAATTPATEPNRDAEGRGRPHAPARTSGAAKTHPARPALQAKGGRRSPASRRAGPRKR